MRYSSLFYPKNVKIYFIEILQFISKWLTDFCRCFYFSGGIKWEKWSETGFST